MFLRNHDLGKKLRKSKQTGVVSAERILVDLLGEASGCERAESALHVRIQGTAYLFLPPE
jgi:hypothetical protein